MALKKDYTQVLVPQVSAKILSMTLISYLQTRFQYLPS